MDGFERHHDVGLCYFFFLSSTFILQITFLNLLIAIMSDTFDRVIDKRTVYSLENKLTFMASMASLLRVDEIEEAGDESKYILYVIKPVGCDEDEETEDSS